MDQQRALKQHCQASTAGQGLDNSAGVFAAWSCSKESMPIISAVLAATNQDASRQRTCTNGACGQFVVHGNLVG